MGGTSTCASPGGSRSAAPVLSRHGRPSAVAHVHLAVTFGLPAMLASPSSDWLASRLKGAPSQTRPVVPVSAATRGGLRDARIQREIGRWQQMEKREGLANEEDTNNGAVSFAGEKSLGTHRETRTESVVLRHSVGA